jgi:hypothetical protein
LQGLPAPLHKYFEGYEFGGELPKIEEKEEVAINEPVSQIAPSQPQTKTNTRPGSIEQLRASPIVKPEFVISTGQPHSYVSKSKSPVRIGRNGVQFMNNTGHLVQSGKSSKYNNVPTYP